MSVRVGEHAIDVVAGHENEQMLLAWYVTSNEKFVPIMQCHEGPYFLSINSLTDLAAACNAAPIIMKQAEIIQRRDYHNAMIGD